MDDYTSAEGKKIRQADAVPPKSWVFTQFFHQFIKNLVTRPHYMGEISVSYGNIR